MSFLKYLFGGGDAQITPPAPSAAPAFSSTSVQSAGQRQLKRRTGGRASTVLSLGSASNSGGPTASAALLGQ